MSLVDVLELNNDLIEFAQVRDALSCASGKAQIEGLTNSAKGFFLAGLFRDLARPILVITYSSEQSEHLADDLSQFGLSKDELFVLPPSDALIYEEGSPDYRVIGQRLAAMDALSDTKPAVVVAPVNGALRRTMEPEALRRNRLEVAIGQTLIVDDFVRRLVDIGYERSEICEVHGEFSQRGGIIDIYPTNEDEPVRIELFGDEVESIRTFDSASQRSTGRRQRVIVLPAREVVLTNEAAGPAAEIIRGEMEEQVRRFEQSGRHEEASRLSAKVEDDILRISNGAYFDGIESYLPYIHPKECGILDYLPASGLVVVDEPHQIVSQWERLEQEMLEVLINRAGRGLLLASTKSQHVLIESAMRRVEEGWPALSFTVLPRGVPFIKARTKLQVESSPAEPFGGRIEMLREQIGTWTGNDARVVIATGQYDRLVELLGEHDIPITAAAGQGAEAGKQSGSLEESGVYVFQSSLRSGFKLPDMRLVVLSDAEVFGMVRTRRPRRVAKEGVPISTILDLKEGDYVVHAAHGIGIYQGITTLTTDSVKRDYLLLEYAGDDRLYVPTEQIDRVQKYIGGEGNEPVVHRLGGSEWQRATKRVKQAVREMAKELIELYAWRQALGGIGFSQDTPWQHEMEAAFPYEETPDQIQAIDEVKRDLEAPKPMDRLICGDVGFGKTEVAIRAAFKVVNDGKQVAILAPTTVLAQQHWNTFKERLGAFPIAVEMLSRFRSRKQQKEVIEGLSLGTVDIVIGTHRLLSKDIDFKDLGLLIIDEEQRFGVGHKERLKRLRKSVDSLSMTATPIPRTLHMSLSGIRDMSVINDPPEGRTPIKTFIKEYDEEIVRESIVRELDRGGQVYFVHNRVENIAHVAAHVAKLVPYARIEIAHGQMAEDDLERVMLDFYDRKFDVLVCTTIIESGLDIPNVNTIIVNDADRMGLAQLYQLRGRVGRSDRQAYAYLMYKGDKILTEIAEKRLEAIREFTDLGSGFRVALRDLEIRGAGNLLGAEQHGQIAAVGFDLYCQLLSQAISELKGEDVEEVQLPSVDLPVDAYIPESYIKAEAQRIFFYKKMTAAKSVREVKQVQDELEDRFGDPPRPVWNMLAILRLRIRCAKVGISSITTEKRQIVIRFAPGCRIVSDVQKELAKNYRRHWFQSDLVRINPDSAQIINLVEDMVDVVAKGLKASANQLQVA
ncbi:MAG: transcription-repair coupling factor [Armatimonadetes bacterium]|nr:transcription-repair coupling factor [Armatimonadota bacterium]